MGLGPDGPMHFRDSSDFNGVACGCPGGQKLSTHDEKKVGCWLCKRVMERRKNPQLETYNKS